MEDSYLTRRTFILVAVAEESLPPTGRRCSFLKIVLVSEDDVGRLTFQGRGNEPCIPINCELNCEWNLCKW